MTRPDRDRFAIDLPTEQGEQLREIAAREHRTLNGIFRVMVERFLRENQQAAAVDGGGRGHDG